MILLKWEEPKAFSRAQEAHEKRAGSKWWLKPAGYAAVFIWVMGLWGLGHLDPKKDPPSLWVALSLALAMAVFLIECVPYMYRWFPVQVRVTEKKIMRLHANTARHIPKEKVTGYVFEELHESRALRVMVRGEPDLVIGLPSADFGQDVRRVLAELKIEEHG